jgi:hypothetical protein
LNAKAGFCQSGQRPDIFSSFPLGGRHSAPSHLGSDDEFHQAALMFWIGHWIKGDSQAGKEFKAQKNRGLTVGLLDGIDGIFHRR